MSFVLDLLTALLAGNDGLGDDIESFRRWRAEAKADAAWAKNRKAMAAHAQADILVLAALHDGVITRTERTELAARLPSLLASAGVETTPEALVERWNGRHEYIASDQDLSGTVKSLARWLSAPQKSQLFDAIVQLHRVDASADPLPTGPYRGGVTSTVASTLRVFGNALGVDEAAIVGAED